jgi:hypothetical protein
MADIGELTGKVLGCWCAPKACHGDVLVKLANQQAKPVKTGIITKKSGLLIATNYVRVVHGGRGDYVEFERDQIVWGNTTIPKRQRWRLEDPNWIEKIFYVEHRTLDGVKIYDQKRTVNYADYKIGMIYISPSDIRRVK